MNPTDKFEQIQIYKRLNPVELEATVLKHEQQIKDLAEHLLELKQSMEFKKEKKDRVGLTEKQIKILLSDSKCWVGDDCSMPNLNYIVRAVEKAHGIGE